MHVEPVDSDAGILACFEVMRHLRELDDAASFLARVRALERSGYRMVAVIEDGRPAAVAGFRIGENLAWGRHLYVDDLVTRPEARARGHGAALLAWLAGHARAAGAGQLHLDSRVEREDAHRFYVRAGLEVSSHHFRRIL